MTVTRSRKPQSGEGITRRGRNTETETKRTRPTGEEKRKYREALTTALLQAHPAVARGNYTGEGVIVLGVSPCMGCVVSAGRIGENDISTALYFQQFNGRPTDDYVERMLRARGLNEYASFGMPLDVLMISPDGTKYRTETLTREEIPSIPKRMKSSYRDGTKIAR